MDVVVVGGTGHIGSFLVPRLVRAGHRVSTVQRGTREPYVADEAWDEVRRVTLDRDAAEAEGSFATTLAGLGADTVVDLTCFTTDSARALLGPLTGSTNHLVHCGTIWVHGPSTVQPVYEDTFERSPVGEYGTAKHAIERLLLAQAELPVSVIHPGHISGPGWPVITPLGNLDADVWRTLAAGRTLRAPGTGGDVMHHVHADDVAQLFQLAVEQPEAAVGHAFHAVAAQAMTVRGFAAATAAWWGHEADLEWISWSDFRAEVAEEHAEASWQHLWRSLVGDISLSRELLGYAPAFTTVDAAHASVVSQVRDGSLDVPEPAPLPTS